MKSKPYRSNAQHYKYTYLLKLCLYLLDFLSVDDLIGDISGDIIRSGAVEQRLKPGDENLSLFPIGLDANRS